MKRGKSRTARRDVLKAYQKGEQRRAKATRRAYQKQDYDGHSSEEEE
jgi:hypothetical protein